MQNIIDLLLRAKKHSLDLDDLNDAFKDDDKYKENLQALLDDGTVFFANNRYYLVNHTNYVSGKIIIKEKGYGFLLSGDEKGDCYVSAENLNGAYSNDFCIAEAETTGFGKRDGVIVKVIKRGTTFIIGDFYEKKGIFYIKSDNSKENFSIVVPKNKTNGAMPDHKVKAIIEEYVDSNLVIASVEKIIGHKNDPGIDILSIVYQYNIPNGFSDELLEEVGKISDHVLENEYEGRVDLRDQNILTIDGDDTKDIDDAIVLWKMDNGNFHLGVHIADVSHYVLKGSLVDDEAYLRGTSVYLVDRVIPMLPHRLSNGICSLNPDCDRLAMSCEMEIDQEGNVVKEKFFPSVIRSRAQMTYKNVNKILDGDPEMVNKYHDFCEMFRQMNELRKILYRKRHNRGSLDFETIESKIYCDENGKAIDVKPLVRGKSERIIEEFMLIANETVAKRMSEWPFIYRIHERPDEEKLSKILAVISNLGYSMKSQPKEINGKILQKFLAKLEGEPVERAVNTLLLRSMMKAKYSEQCLGHFGLASEFYTHFTSPIRRYPDLIVHRLMREFLFNHHTSELNQKRILDNIKIDAMHTSEKEKEAQECERDCDDMKKAEYMESFIGQEYVGMITSIMPFGFFVELPNTIEGLVNISSLTDYFNYDEVNMILIGERSAKIFKIGDMVKVRVVKSSKATSEIDFELIESDRKNKVISKKPLGKKFKNNGSFKKKGRRR